MIVASHNGRIYVAALICDGCGEAIETTGQSGRASLVFSADPPAPLYVVCSARCRVVLVERKGWSDYQARALINFPEVLDKALHGETATLGGMAPRTLNTTNQVKE